MRKTIKLKPSIYQRLDDFRTKDESFNGAIERLLDIRDGIVALTHSVQRVTTVAKYQVKKLQETLAPADVVPTDLTRNPLIERRSP